ncbi:hypothetical protein SESBI_43104 [Sesbania bispinosa]|nr:hypothetical protein SESBI_43104 [Sesbania bispinosa]
MAAKNQAKLAEKLLKKQVADAKRKEEEAVAMEAGLVVEKQKGKRQRLTAAVPPPSPVVPLATKQPTRVLA